MKLFCDNYLPLWLNLDGQENVLTRNIWSLNEVYLLIINCTTKPNQYHAVIVFQHLRQIDYLYIIATCLGSSMHACTTSPSQGLKRSTRKVREYYWNVLDGPWLVFLDWRFVRWVFLLHEKRNAEACKVRFSQETLILIVMIDLPFAPGPEFRGSGSLSPEIGGIKERAGILRSTGSGKSINVDLLTLVEANWDFMSLAN